MKKLFSLTLFLVVLFLAQICAAVNVPYLTGRVTDNAQVLSADKRQAITGILKAHEDKTGNQIAVLTVPTLEGEGIEEYALAVFNTWKLGQKGKDNGILIVVAPGDRRMRIEVGYGLEGALTDGRAGSIIRNSMAPHFKNEDYNAGIEAGVKAVVSVLEGGTLPATVAPAGKKASPGLNLEGPELSIIEKILIGAFIFGIIGLFTFIGIITPGIGWFLYFFLIPFWAMFPLIILGSAGAFYLLIIYLIGYPLAKIFLKKTDWYKKAQKDLRTKGKASIGGFTIGSGSSGGSWSSGSSGGGFSGGGGSSGGGGASGSW
ncbi:MAG TPA: YgcG family protein [Deltaproteobacteria bacterium]|nr:YgcG family protein [Deltaproteobacteria bacterium]